MAEKAIVPYKGKKGISYQSMVNNALRGKLTEVLFGKVSQGINRDGYLSPLSRNLTLTFKKNGRLFGIMEIFDPTNFERVHHTSLHGAAKALQIEILNALPEIFTKIKGAQQNGLLELEENGDGKVRCYLWEINPDQDLNTAVGKLINLLQHPPLGNLPELISNLIGSIKQPEKYTEEQIRLNNTALLKLKPGVQAFVIGEAIKGTKQVGSWRENWFTLYAFDKKINPLILSTVGYPGEGLSLKISLEERSPSLPLNWEI